MLHGVAVQELNRRPYLHDHNVRVEHQALLVHDRLLRWRRKGFARDGIDVDDGLPGRYFAFDCAGDSGGCDSDEPAKA